METEQENGNSRLNWMIQNNIYTYVYPLFPSSPPLSPDIRAGVSLDAVDFQGMALRQGRYLVRLAFELGLEGELHRVHFVLHDWGVGVCGARGVGGRQLVWCTGQMS